MSCLYFLIFLPLGEVKFAQAIGWCSVTVLMLGRVGEAYWGWSGRSGSQVTERQFLTCLLFLIRKTWCYSERLVILPVA